jgi:hypothetical protein
MSIYATASISSLALAEGAFSEMSYVLQRASIAGAVGLAAGPLFFLKKAKRPPMWRTPMLGASALASISLPFLCIERLCYHAITRNVNTTSLASAQQQFDTRQNALYASHALGTILGAGMLHVSKKSKGPFRVPIPLLASMLCKAHIEAVLLDR